MRADGLGQEHVGDEAAEEREVAGDDGVLEDSRLGCAEGGPEDHASSPSSKLWSSSIASEASSPMLASEVASLPSSASSTVRASSVSGSSSLIACGIAELGNRLDGGGDRVGVGVGEELAEQLEHAGLGHLGEDVGQLRQGGRADGQALEGALDAAGDLLEALEGERLQLLAGGAAGLRVVGGEHVDERVEHPRALVLAEQGGDADQPQGRLVLARLAQRGGQGAGEGVEQIVGG